MSIEAWHLTKSYGQKLVVNKVTFNVKPGEVVGLLGPNGAGKTTTFYMLVGLERADGGKIIVDGNDITCLPLYKRSKLGLGYLSQEPSIFRTLTVEDNIRIILEGQELTYRQQQDILETLLFEFDINQLRDRKGYVLSGGERRRVEIARTLATSPSYILLDEPFTGVDPISINEIQEIILNLKSSGLGVLITDHNVRETLAITDRAYIMHRGNILIAGDSTEVAENELARKFYLGDNFSL